MASSDPTRESPLAMAELADAEALVREAGWNQVADDWHIFLELGTVFAAHADKRVVATAAILPYGRFAWISMVLVAGDHRRRGLATRLLRRCIDEITAAGRVPILDATPEGRAVYRLLGFEESWGFHRLARYEKRPLQATPTAERMAIGAVTDAIWPALCAYDAAAFGADRSALLARLRKRLPAAALVAQRDDRLIGLLLGRDGRTATQLGPLVAEDDATALALLARAIDAIEGAVCGDLADGKPKIRAWLEAGGFAGQRPFIRMLHRRRTGFDDPERTFAVIGPEFG
jgi:GNAT superfamily N-acetyltransferase